MFLYREIRKNLKKFAKNATFYKKFGLLWVKGIKKFKKIQTNREKQLSLYNEKPKKIKNFSKMP